MAKKSIFREFISVLRKRWKEEMPSVQPLAESRGALPKASTFYAGVMKGSGQHVYLHFQHSSKAWEVGRFTINVVLSADAYAPQRRQLFVEEGRSDSGWADGSYRIGHLVGEKDKWWHLRPESDSSVLCLEWRPCSYDNLEAVLSEAAGDVTRDILSTMQLLGLTSGLDLKAQPGVAPNGGPAERSGHSAAPGGPPSVS